MIREVALVSFTRRLFEPLGTCGRNLNSADTSQSATGHKSWLDGKLDADVVSALIDIHANANQGGFTDPGDCQALANVSSWPQVK
jgi:hypothetical protein